MLLTSIYAENTSSQQVQSQPFYFISQLTEKIQGMFASTNLNQQIIQKAHLDLFFKKQKTIKKNQCEDGKPYIQVFHRQQDMSVVISKRPKSEEDQMELKDQNAPDPERLEQESSNFNSPKVIKSLNQSMNDNDDSPANLQEQISIQNEVQNININDYQNQETGNFGSQSPAVTSKNFELKFQKVTTPGFGSATSENSTKETRQVTLTGKKKEDLSKDSHIQININLEENLHAPTPKSEIPKEEFYVERRYCTICNQEQILRSKHCKQCGKCVACYDHHCPWVGNCVGEKNRCAFYWYLVMQLTQILIVIIKVFLEVQLSVNYFVDNLLFLLSSLIVLFFLVMVSSLLIYHSYLAIINLTTWENVSWYKISYLKELPNKIESPFSVGILGNLKLYCRFSVPEITIWTYNQRTIQALLTH